MSEPPVVDVGTGGDTGPVPLLERAPALAALAQYADECAAGEGRLVLVSGEAGAGKSALVEAFAATRPDLRWLHGACDGLSTPRPLGPLFDVAAQSGGDLLAACGSGAHRDELFAALLRELDAPGAVTVLVLEDLHWADESTLDLLRFLSRRLRALPVLCLATYRDDGIDATNPLRLLLGDLTSDRTTRRLPLPPLSHAAVTALMAGTDRSADDVYRLTGGNAFFVAEIVQAPAGAIPQSARDAVLARVARLSDDARRTVHAAALIGARIDPALLTATTGSGPGVLDELAWSGVIVGDAEHLRFRHELTRLAVAAEVPVHRRRSIHLRILDALQVAGCDDDARLAHHAEAGDDRAAVLRFAPRAARRAAELAAHREAAAQYQRALRFVGDEQSASAAELYDRFADECSCIDRWHEAAEAREHALRLWRGLGKPLREGAALRQLSRTMFRLCRGVEAAELAEAAIAVLEPHGRTAELAWAEANRANQYMLDSRFDEAIEAARRAAAIATELDLPGVLSDALDSEAAALSYLDRDWEPTMLRALAVALDAGADEQAGRAYSNLCGLYRDAFRFAETERYVAEGERFGEDHDLDTFLSCIRGRRVSVLVATGRWDDALDAGRPLLRPGAASPVNRLEPLLGVGTVLARRGDPAAAALLNEAVDVSLGTAEPLRIGVARLARAEAYWLAGRDEELAKELDAVTALAGDLDRVLRGSLAVWLRRCGRDVLPSGPFLPPHAATVAGHHSAAERLWTELDCPFDAALARLDSGTEAGLRDAQARFDALGAAAAVQATRREMRRLGLRPVRAGARPATRAHPMGLTAREQEVLELLALGRSNNAIAAELFISVKTAGHHVSAVLAKLGVRSRRDAAAEAERLGLVERPTGR